MPDLYKTLLKYDLGQLHIIAGLWGLELDSRDLNSAAEELAASLLDFEAVTETIDILPTDAVTALRSLIASDGKMEWAAFARNHGEIREMGPGRRDREQPHKKPISSAETLFYYGFLAKAFFDTEKGSQEFAYIPDDLLELLGHEELDEEQQTAEPLGRPATPVEKAFEIPATDYLLDDATTYLAALRMGKTDWQPTLPLQTLLNSAKIIKKNVPNPEAVKKFLEISRVEALDLLYKAWLDSQTFDELRLIPTIICEGEWSNSPRETRQTILNFIHALPQGKWWSLPAFLRDLKTKHPDFQRPAGDYDSWFIKRKVDGQFLRGFAYWDQVDGALVKYLIENLHWLGMVDLASTEEGKEFTAFRISGVKTPSKVEGKVLVTSNGRIAVSRMFSRAVRYQIARFCEWEENKNDEFIYSVSARSLKRASEQGLKAEQLLAMLVKYTNSNVPPTMVKALKRWELNGTEARVESLLVLRVSRPEVLEEMRNSKAGKFLGEILSPTAVVVKEGAIQKVMAALAELGLLADVLTTPPTHD
ncbi:MAG: helicase-associated domain-containing protein [Anaerolineales bacterium]